MVRQADSAAADEAGRRANALLAASQATAQLKASQVQEQQVVAGFLQQLCEQVSSGSPKFCHFVRIGAHGPLVVWLVGRATLHVWVWDNPGSSTQKAPQCTRVSDQVQVEGFAF